MTSGFVNWQVGTVVHIKSDKLEMLRRWQTLAECFMIVNNNLQRGCNKR